jgi:16S rRNA processing protein RimM
MNDRSYITAGKVVGVFGVKGWVKVKTFTETPGAILDYAPWFFESPRTGRLEERLVVESRVTDKGVVVLLKDINDRDEAKALVGAGILIDKSLLPVLEESEFYWHELEGLRVRTLTGADLGSISHLMETGANDVVVVKGDDSACDQRERLIPYLPQQVIKTVDLGQRLMTVDWDPAY